MQYNVSPKLFWHLLGQARRFVVVQDKPYQLALKMLAFTFTEHKMGGSVNHIAKSQLVPFSSSANLCKMLNVDGGGLLQLELGASVVNHPPIWLSCFVSSSCAVRLGERYNFDSCWFQSAHHPLVLLFQSFLFHHPLFPSFSLLVKMYRQFLMFPIF